MNFIGRIGATSVVLLLSTYYAVSYYLHYGELEAFEFFGDVIYLALAWWGGAHFDKARALSKELQKKQQERNNSLKTVKESEERYRTLVEFCPDAIYVHSEGKLVFANKAGLILLGAHREEDLLGKNIWQIVDPEYKDKVEERIHVSRETNRSLALLEERFIALDGRRVNVEVATMPITYIEKPANQVIVRDITDKKKLENELREQDERLRKITDNMSDSLIHLNDKFQFEYVSSGTIKILGYDPSVLLGITVFEIIHPDDEETVKKEIQKINQGQSQIILEFRIKHADNDYVWVESVASGMFETTGKVKGYTIVSRNITDRKEKEQIIHKQDQLLQAVSNATYLLLTLSDYKKAIVQTLTILGKAVEADRSYIFEHKDNGDDNVINLLFEWTNDKVEGNINNPLFQNYSYQKSGFNRWLDKLSHGDLINNAVKDCPMTEREILERSHIKAILAVPIFINDTYWGFIGFDDCTNAKKWSKNEEMILNAAASSIGGAIHRKQRESVLREALYEKQISEERLKETNEILKLHSSIDGLTGIANRRYFDELLLQEWNKAVNQGSNLSLIMLDIDYFKKYNDAYGHLGGDDCLKRIARKLNEIAVQYGVIAARYGGEEFAVIVSTEELEKVEAIAEKIRASIEELSIPHIASRLNNIVTISLGVSTCNPTLQLKHTDLIEDADNALYNSKKSGRNRVTVKKYGYVNQT